MAEFLRERLAWDMEFVLTRLDAEYTGFIDIKQFQNKNLNIWLFYGWFLQKWLIFWDGDPFEIRISFYHHYQSRIKKMLKFGCFSWFLKIWLNFEFMAEFELNCLYFNFEHSLFSRSLHEIWDLRFEIHLFFKSEF